jgi:cellulose synthase/poly-beta-1,6-N-acetylglucosamine synthase-like glycosyltransferase
MQSLEFMALMASGGASLYFNKAIMCNGANLAYSKDVFNEVNGFQDIYNTASGDDVLLMYKIKKKYPKRILFLKHTEAIVFTKAKSTLKEFINQRIRWASKSYSDLNTETKFISALVYLFNLTLLLSFIMAFHYTNSYFYLSILKIGLILFGIKCIIDFLLLFLAGTFFNKKRLLIYFLPEQLLYMFYIVAIGLLGFIGNYKWKGRDIKN